MKVVIIKYNAGNVASVQFALERIGLTPVISDDAAVIRSADKVIFPGVGEASSAMASLRSSGLDGVIRELKQPTLGICLGMQLLCLKSDEGNTQGLGIFDTQVRKMKPGNNNEKIPHMGWNTIGNCRGALYTGISNGSFVYYVHGFAADVCASTSAITDYTTAFSASLQRGNFFGVQYHPEKSGTAGELILKNFLSL